MTTYADLQAAQRAYEHLQWHDIYVPHWSRSETNRQALSAASANYQRVKAAHEISRQERIAIRRSVRIEDRQARLCSRHLAILRKRAALGI